MLSVEAVVLACGSRWPGIRLDANEFSAHLERSQIALDSGLPQSRFEELYLVLACLQGDRIALTFLEAFFNDAEGWLRKRRWPDVLVDEVVQQLRVNLLVRQDERQAGLLAFSGRGSLRQFIRASGVRLAIDRTRQGGRTDELNSAAQLRAAVTSTPEHVLMGEENRALLVGALREAFFSLEVRERNLVRLFYIEKIRIEKLAQMFRMGERTISRQLQRTREALRFAVQERLKSALNLSVEELESFLRALPSGIEISLRTPPNSRVEV